MINKYQAFTNQAKGYGFRNVVQQDFLTWEPGMKFDVVIGNPPYQNPNPNASSGKLWPKFVAMMMQRTVSNGHTAVIVPNTWTKGVISSQGSGKILMDLANKNTIAIKNPLDKNYFPSVGMTLSYFVCHNSTHQSPTTVYFADGATLICLWDFPCLCASAIGTNIVQKVLKKNKPLAFQLNTNTKNKNITFDPTSTIKVSTNGKILYATDVDKLLVNVVIVPWASSLQKTVSGDFVPGDQTLVFTDYPVDSLHAYILSKISQFVVNQTRTAMHNEAVRFLPEIDLTRHWSDTELYAHFGLTQEEIDYVEANVK